jgi:hypothetical protein
MTGNAFVNDYHSYSPVRQKGTGLPDPEKEKERPVQLKTGHFGSSCMLMNAAYIFGHGGHSVRPN